MTSPSPATCAVHTLCCTSAAKNRRQAHVEGKNISPPRPPRASTSTWWRRSTASAPAAAASSARGFLVYQAHSHEIPTLLPEIGRLREVTFRAVGEGTGNDVDLDKYDRYYEHLILWDEEKEQVAGAYRLGRADVILRE